jgi:hypothetical protein
VRRISFHDFHIVNPSPFQVGFYFGRYKKGHTIQRRENLEVAARVGFCVWLRNVAQAQTSALVLCGGGFASS